AAEHRMLVSINERPAMQLTCTPEYLDELVLGRLLTEGLIRGTEDVEQIYVCEKGQRAKAALKPDAFQRLTEAGVGAVNTCCTDNRSFLASPADGVRTAAPVHWEAAWLKSMGDKTSAEQSLYGETHAAHACCLFREDRLLCCREDIGRHNALDKAIGWALRSGEDLASCMLYTTGRLPVDMVAKAIRAGVPLLASKTFPTDQGIETARQARLTLITVRPDGTITVWNDGQK
nr:formate dehydrogenase accessory sulfurtransferase FdhD [Clostridium sp.]